MKVTVIGAGAVGATTADNIARAGVCTELVLLDIKEGIAEGKAQDMQQTAALLGFDTKITGSTNDYSKTANSDVVVITSGIPRKPGMTREELIGTNAGIVKAVCKQVLEFSPNTIIIVVSNPMDTMTYLALKSTGLPKHRIIGMGGTLDSSRFKYQLSQHLECSASDLNAIVVGGHGDTTMIPLISKATWNSIPVTQFLSQEQQDKIVTDTMVGGATLTKLIGTSAWYAPGAAAAQMVEAIVRDQKRIFPVCAWLNGEYGMKDIYLGVPVILGKNGIEKIIELKLNDAEKALLEESAVAVRGVMEVLDNMNAEA